MSDPLIIHVDMDAFYASVEILDNSQLAGKCVIVGGHGNRGVVCAASYEARDMGVCSAQPIVRAKKLCPKGIFLPVRMKRYMDISERVFSIFSRFTPFVEPISIDEAFLDVTGSTRLFGPGERIGADIREAILKEIGITASAGVAQNKLVAKIASDLCKPDGLKKVEPQDTLSFLEPLPISRLWGVGPVALKKLELLGVTTIGEARRLSRKLLKDNFGKFGDAIYDFSRGIDPRPVEPPAAAKSVGREITFDKDVTDNETARKKLLYLSEQVAVRLRGRGVCGRTICLKVKYSDFTQVTRSATIEIPTDDTLVIFELSKKLMQKTLIGKKRVRLLGISASHLARPGVAWQPGLFDSHGDMEKRKKLHQAVDNIRDKFGSGAVSPASLVKD